ncbi:MAG TPA: uroporphyrinogen decarboxylase family protein [Bacteroidota bacterium]|nr:uroporphyrinogen decarboxylase family protein [Bacteroidota bacterium]
MTDQQWDVLVRVIDGEEITPLPVGFIIDCPWLPNWYGITIMDYFSNDELWLAANLKAMSDFPEVIFLPGFWSEYGMCTEPSAFGARMMFPPNDFPHAHKTIHSTQDIHLLSIPNPKTDGMLPFVLNRLKLAQPKIEQAGHKIRFAVARGPLNIATFLMGATEFLTLMMTEPDEAHMLLKKITAFLTSWLRLQKETFPTIDGILLLDDIIGFIGEEEFCTFALPYFTELYASLDVSVKFLHNDAPSAVSAPYLPAMGVNLFNMGVDVTLNELKAATDNRVTLLGNLPPRDVLASATAGEVSEKTRLMLEELSDRRRTIASCGGGMPPGVRSENIRAFLDAAKTFYRPA